MRGVLFFVTIAMFMSSCSIFSHAGKTDKQDTKTGQQTTTETQQQQTEQQKADEQIKKDETAGVTDPKKIKIKDSYKVAYVLPFSIDGDELNMLMGEDKITGYQPLAAVEFYEGSLMAMDTLRKLGVNLEISIYDNKRDSLSTALMFQTNSLKDVDLIIGPVFNESLKAGAAYAKANEVYLVSPLSPSSNITTQNQFFLMANSTLNTQLGKTIGYISSKQQQANFIIVYRTDKENEVKIASEFKAAFDAIKKTHPGITLRETYSYAGISPNLNTSNNFVFIASNEELFVNSLLRDLSKSSRESGITLIGLQSILTFESVSLDYFETLKLHYPTAYWVDQDLAKVESFNKAFTEKYDIKPSDYAYRGYDITLYFGAMLLNYGIELSENLDKLNTVAPIMLGNFHFTPCKNGEGIKFYENENISVVKYENYKFQKVN